MDHTKSKTGFGKLSKLVHGWETGMSVIQLGATSPPYSQGWSSFNCSFTSFRAASQAGKLTQPWREEQCSLVLHFNPSELTKRYWIPDCSQDESSQHIPHMHFSVETEVQWCRHSVPPCLCDVSHLVPYGISLSLSLCIWVPKTFTDNAFFNTQRPKSWVAGTIILTHFQWKLELHRVERGCSNISTM